MTKENKTKTPDYAGRLNDAETYNPSDVRQSEYGKQIKRWGIAGGW
jgi:hypothetical protein